MRNNTDSVCSTIRAASAGALIRAQRHGGAIFGAALLGSIIFCIALFNLRSDKIFSLPAAIEHASKEDTVAFHRAAQMATTGDAAAAYDPSAFQETLVPPNDKLLWLNPPHAFLILAPLGLLDYAGVKIVWIGLSFLSLILVTRLAAPRRLFYVASILSPAAFASLLVMQSGPFVALGLTYAFLYANKRPAAAGLVFALLTVKPQYGLMAPIFLAATGSWRAIAWSVALTAVLVAISIGIFGIEPWIAFCGEFNGALRAHAGGIHRDMVSIGQLAAKLDLSFGLAAQCAAILALAAAVLAAAKRMHRDAAVAFALFASAAASPSLWVYDWPLFMAGLFLFARAASPWPIHVQVVGGALWIAPLISLGFATIDSSIATTIIVIVAAIVFFIHGHRLRAPAS